MTFQASSMYWRTKHCYIHSINSGSIWIKSCKKNLDFPISNNSDNLRLESCIVFDGLLAGSNVMSLLSSLSLFPNCGISIFESYPAWSTVMVGKILKFWWRINYILHILPFFGSKMTHSAELNWDKFLLRK